MIIADAGSTSTKIVLRQSTGVQHLVFGPMNPNYHSFDHIQGIVGQIRDCAGAHIVDQVFVYGSGCAVSKARSMVERAFQAHFPNSDIEVAPDTLGSARALFKRHPGLLCILGTGSNACVYDGTELKQCSPSLGYILGDEGSGLDLAKELIKSFFYGDLPNDLRQRWSEQIPDRNCLSKNCIPMNFPIYIWRRSPNSFTRIRPINLLFLWFRNVLKVFLTITS